MEGVVLLLIIQLSLCVRGVPLNTQDVTVSVNTSQWVHLIDDRFLSLSVPPTFFLTDNYSNVTKNMLHGLSPAYLRVGGSQSDKLYFNSPTNDSDGVIVTMRQWKALQQLSEDTGVKVIFTVNPSPRQLTSDNWDNSDILKLLQLSDDQGVNVTPYLQLGYAPFLVEMSGLTLGQDVTRLHKVLDLFPRYQSTAVLGPDFPLCVSPDCLRFIRNYLLMNGDIVNALIFQLKPEIDEWEEKVAIEKLTRVINDVDAKILTRNTLESNNFMNIPKKQLWLTENGKEEYTGAFTDALVWTLRVGHTAKLGYDVVLQQLGHLTEPSPNYWVSLLFHQLVGRAVLDAYPASHPSVTVFAHCSSSSYKPGAVTVWGVNAAESVLSLMLPHSHALVYSLTAGYHGSTFLNGKELRLIHGVSLPELHPREITAGPASIPAYSVFYIVLPDLKAPACKTYTNLNSPSTNLLQRDTISHVPQSRIEHIGHYSTSDSRNKSKLKIMEQSTKMNEDSIKETFETASQYLSKNDNDLIGPLAKKSFSSKMETKSTESGIENKMFGLFDYLRSKRSLSKDSQVSDSELPPSLHTTLSNMPFNSFKKLQQIYKVMDDKNFQKYQHDLLPKNSTYKEFNSHVKETSNIHYFPGEFYNKLRTLVSKSNKQQSDMEDPHEAVAVVSELLPTYSLEDSTLQVTSKPSNDPRVDKKIVEQTTETMERYYKQAEQFLSQASCGNSKHKEKMNCCMGHIKPTEIASSQFELRDEERLNESVKDRGLKNNESLQLTKTKNKDAHIETLYKRMKREINKYIQSNESPLLNSSKLMPVKQTVKDPLEDDESITLYLEELTDEGEQLLKTFDRDYGINHLDDKFRSGTSLNADNKNVSNVNTTYLNVSNDFFSNRMSKVSTKLATNNVMPSQKSKLDTTTENEGGSRFNSSSLVVSVPIKGESKPELVVDASKLYSKINNGKSSQSNNENRFDRSMAITVDKLPIISQELSDSSTMYPTHYVSNDSSSSTPEQTQVNVKTLSKSVENSDKHSKESILKNNQNQYYQVGNLNKGINFELKTQTYQTSTPPNVQNDFPPRLDSLSSTQLKLNKQSNTNTLPIYRLQRTRIRPPYVNSSVFKTTSRPQSTVLRMMVSSMRKQRLEALRARLNKARERLLNLATRNSGNEQRVSKRATPHNQSILDSISKVHYLNTSKLERHSMKTERSNEDRKYLKDNMFEKPQFNKAELVHQLRSERKEGSIENLPKFENNLNKLGYNHVDSKYTEGTTNAHLKTLIDTENVLKNRKPRGVSFDKEAYQLRESRSIQKSCVQDRFNDFESGQDHLQQSTNLQYKNEQVEMRPMQQTNQPIDSNKNETNISSSTPKTQSFQKNLKILKRSISNKNQNNDFELTKLLANEIDKEGPLQDISILDTSMIDTLKQTVLSNNAANISGIDKLMKLAKEYHNTNHNSIDVLDNTTSSNIDKDNDNSGKENNSMEEVDIEDYKSIKDFLNKNIPHVQEETGTKKYNNVATTTPNMFMSQTPDVQVQEEINNNSLKNNFIQHFVNKIQTFFKAITSVIKNLSSA